jgi:prolyl-tRNA editing enzyme YbaK/EbsC (Cys-tRNA(Pro) deacylase)
VWKLATKSVLKTIHIKSRRSALALVNAVENASKKRSKEVIMRRSHSTASAEEVKKMFGVPHDGL